MVRKIAVIAIALALAGCASTIMKNYMGQPLQMAMVDYGPPVNAFDMPDGTRAFQWIMKSTYVTPVQSNTTGIVTGYGNMAQWNSRTTITGGVPISNECAYTMFGTWDEQTQSWRLTSFKKPKLMCE